MLAELPDDWEIPAPPTIPDWLRWAWRGWLRLHRDRPYTGGGMGAAGPRGIPWRDVTQWCDRYGHDSEYFDVIVEAMDKVYLTWHAAKVEQEIAAAKANRR